MSEPVFTCISCCVAFPEPSLQRTHFASDWHRYNMKRRVATLPPVSALVYNQKVTERRDQLAIRPDPKGMQCDACSKAFSTENAYRSHVNSKKHREREANYHPAVAAPDPELEPEEPSDDESEAGPSNSSETEEEVHAAAAPEPAAAAPVDEVPSYNADEDMEPVEAEGQAADDDEEEEDVAMSFEARLAAARAQIKPTSCLFCTTSSASIPENMTHMSKAHSFFLPDQEFLEDLPGLLMYLGEKIAVANTCLYCPNGGKEFSSLEAVRAHMRDKSHCKVAYDTEIERLELSDWYNFEKSYPDADLRRARRRERRLEKQRLAEEKAQEWEDLEEEEGETMEVDEDDEEVEEGESDDESDAGSDSDMSEISNEGGASFAPDGLSLQLPSGRTLGHRSLKLYYSQRLRPVSLNDSTETTVSTKVADIRKRLNDPTQALVPVRGGHGGYGAGLEVMKARNAGEAKWAKKMGRNFTDQKMRELHKTRVAFVHNSQKHFRDPLLQ